MSRALKVGYVLKRYPRYSETFVVNEILVLERAGVEVEIFSLRHPEDGHFQDSIARVRAPVSYLSAAGLRAAELWEAAREADAAACGLWGRLGVARDEDARHVYQALRLAAEARVRGIAHLHAHFATEATTVARLAGRFAELSYSFTAHAKDIFHQSVRREALRTKLSEASGVVTVSDFNVGYLERLDAPSARIERIYNGLELDRFPFREPRTRPPLVLAVGRLVEKKGFGDLLEACARLRAEGVDHRCQIIGTGLLERDLREHARRLQLEETVQFLGPRPQAEVIERLRCAAAFAAPCVLGEDGNRDGLPTVLIEAMALGTPCVSTDVTGIPEVLRDGETGLAVPPGDVPALAEAIERLLGDAELRVRLARTARKLIELEFDVERNARALLRLFRASGSGAAEGSA